MSQQSIYAPGHLQYKRILSREVNIGGVPVGGHNPIRIQSMTTTDTMDTMGTVEQTLRMVASGSEYVRITAPSKKEAHNLAEIKAELRRRGCMVPLVADIHFTPNAAEIAARIVEKVRVNPGNYADKKRFQQIDYTDASYQEELERIYKRFSPLVKICKEEGTAMRIGTNHGSLSDRIMSRYGDTPHGMVESAMEFVRICEDHGFHDICISMKASNPQVMVQAYRMLMEQMIARDLIYPLHLGVTEAGEGEDGRIKSALGITTLLLDGIGDTVRVSLTEEPEHENPVAQFLVNHVIRQVNNRRAVPAQETEGPIQLPFDPYAFKKRETVALDNMGGDQVPRVVADIRHACGEASDLKPIGYTYIPALDKYNFADIAADFAYFGDEVPAFDLPGGLKRIYNVATWNLLTDRAISFPYFSSVAEFQDAASRSETLNFVRLTRQDLDSLATDKAAFESVVCILAREQALPAYDWRHLVYELDQMGLWNPVLLELDVDTEFAYYNGEDIPEYVRIDDVAKTQLAMASDGSTLLVDGRVSGLWLPKADDVRVRAAFGMLQLARLRITKTEYISCPSCGRTLFDLQETTARIRKRTEHLKGVKIGIMGCIVNGPGEMADADYGYVGVGPDKIALYRGQEVVERGVRTAEAVDKLIDLIRADGNWVEPVVEEVV
ncbi:MAG: (E)-4-hydroxy-3-methylbut-2-enyl-diphosphate synthase [Bacteroidota bacterium]